MDHGSFSYFLFFIHKLIFLSRTQFQYINNGIFFVDNFLVPTIFVQRYGFFITSLCLQAPTSYLEDINGKNNYLFDRFFLSFFFAENTFNSSEDIFPSGFLN